MQVQQVSDLASGRLRRSRSKSREGLFRTGARGQNRRVQVYGRGWQRALGMSANDIQGVREDRAC